MVSLMFVSSAGVRRRFRPFLLLFAGTVILLCGVTFQASSQQGGTGNSAAPLDTIQPVSLKEVQHSLDTGHSEAALQMAEALPAQTGRSRLLGECLYALGRLHEADVALAEALKLDPNDLEAIQLHGLVLFRLGRPADAIPLLERAHAWTEKTRTDPAYVLALCYIEVQRYDDARHAFAQQYGFPGDSAAAHLLAARMLLRRDFVSIAQQEAQKALEIDSSLPLAHRLLGEVALAGEHLEEAAAEFEKERARNPLDGSTYDRLGDTYARAGDYVRAQQMLDRALLLEPASTAPYILLGKVLLKRQDPASAAGYLERAEAMDPANFITHTLLIQAYHMMGRTEDAHRETDMAQKLHAEAPLKLQPLK